MSESRDVTWRHIEFRSCVWPVDVVSAQRNIYESYVGTWSRTVGLRNAYGHTRCTGAIAPCREVCVALTKRMKEKKEESRRENVIIYCMLCRGGVWGWQVGRPPQAPLLRGAPALQTYEFVKLYSPVNWKCWYMLRLKSFFKVKFRSVVLGCLLCRNRHNQCLR